MKTHNAKQRIKAAHAQDQAWWLGDHFILPADAASYERMVSQVARALCHSDNFRPNWATSYSNAARAAIRAIGIVPPRTGKGQK